MTRRSVIFAGAALRGLALAEEKPLSGKLVSEGKIQMPGGRSVIVAGDESVSAVLADPRVIGLDLEIEGSPAGEGRFAANPIYRKPIHTYKDGKRMIVSYWCEICYIRFYKPGSCWCCQKESVLDFKDPNTPERVP